MQPRDKDATGGPIPQHCQFTFPEDGVNIRSDFDSGNLSKAERVASYTYSVWTGPDCMGTAAETSCRSWFYFCLEAAAGVEVTLTVKNLNLQGKLFREGMRPVVRPESQEWSRLSVPTTWTVTGDIGNQFEVTFSYVLVESRTFFAFTYPWSYSDSLALNDWVVAECHDKGIYCHKEVLVYSLEGRKCEVLTISSQQHLTEERDSSLPGVYPESTERSCLFQHKPVVFVTARVHPGETPGSFAMNGLLKFICSKDPRAEAARDEFVFKLVPIVNPDGVYRGYYRTDTRGLNLNRHYAQPSQKRTPTVSAIRALLLHTHSHWPAGVYCCVDLHAHASKRACFILGNSMTLPQLVESWMIPKLLAMNSPVFDFAGSCFAEQNSRSRSDDDRLKDGSARVAFFHLTKNIRCYTLECNYHSGHVLNKLKPSGLEEPQEFDSESEVYAHGVPAYTVPIFEGVGRALVISVLDSIGKNPFSRIDTSLSSITLEIGRHLANAIPFRSDRALFRALATVDTFEEYLRQKKKPQGRRSYRPPSRYNEESKACRGRPPLGRTRFRQVDSVQRLGHSVSGASLSPMNLRRSVELRMKETNVLTTKNSQKPDEPRQLRPILERRRSSGLRKPIILRKERTPQSRTQHRARF